MQGSPSIKPFEERAKAWATKLVLIQDLIDIWLKVQGVWQYLEPIFGSEDIMRQMPEEGKLFKKQDGMWRENAKKIVKDVRCLVVADIPGLLESYKEQYGFLETVQKGLNDYLEMKRLYFPRFFFLCAHTHHANPRIPSFARTPRLRHLPCLCTHHLRKPRAVESLAAPTTSSSRFSRRRRTRCACSPF